MTNESGTESLLATCEQLRELARDLAATGCAAASLGIESRIDDHVAPLLATAQSEVDRLQALIEPAQQAQVQNLAADTPLYLNLGSGAEAIEGWVNVDLFGGDVVADLRGRLPFESNSVKAIYAAHVLEHLHHPNEAWALLAECRRILRRGGRMRIVVPDIAAYLDAYRDADEASWGELAALRGWDPAGNRLDPLLRYAGTSHHPGNFFGHAHGYDQDSLVELIASVGFGPIRMCSYQGSSEPHLQIDDHSAAASAHHGKRPLSLFVEAVALF